MYSIIINIPTINGKGEPCIFSIKIYVSPTFTVHSICLSHFQQYIIDRYFGWNYANIWNTEPNILLFFQNLPCHIKPAAAGTDIDTNISSLITLRTLNLGIQCRRFFIENKQLKWPIRTVSPEPCLARFIAYSQDQRYNAIMWLCIVRHLGKIYLIISLFFSGKKSLWTARWQHMAGLCVW